MDVFIPGRFRTQVQLAPHNIIGNIEDQIYTKIRKTLEGVCSRYGYIRPTSIEIVKRSLGMLIKAHFNGHIKYDIVCKADICNPVRGMIFKAIVKNKNDLGILAENSITIDGNTMPILDVLIPRRSAGITSDIDLDMINIGDEIFIEVLGKRYQLNDKKISIIARAVKEPSKKKLKQVVATETNIDDINGGVGDCVDPEGNETDCDENDDAQSEDGEEEDSDDDSDGEEEEESGEEEEEEEEEEDPDVDEGEADGDEGEPEEDPYGGVIGEEDF